jgi:dephospho-CoA kinase
MWKTSTMNKPLLIGLTGGIGSGKTTVARMFEALGVPVFYSDEEAKALYNRPEIKEKIAETAGHDVFDGEALNRKRLAEKIFTNPELRQKVNGIIHPEVRKAFAEFVLRHAEAPYVINEAAILFESGSYSQFTKIILVTAPEQVRVNRLRDRDDADTETIKKRMEAQWPDEQKIPLADFVIENVDLEKTGKAVQTIHDELINSANRPGIVT